VLKDINEDICLALEDIFSPASLTTVDITKKFVGEGLTCVGFEITEEEAESA
jgi:hypothetical protein